MAKRPAQMKPGTIDMSASMPTTSSEGQPNTESAQSFSDPDHPTSDQLFAARRAEETHREQLRQQNQLVQDDTSQRDNTTHTNGVIERQGRKKRSLKGLRNSWQQRNAERYKKRIKAGSTTGYARNVRAATWVLLITTPMFISVALWWIVSIAGFGLMAAVEEIFGGTWVGELVQLLVPGHMLFLAGWLMTMLFNTMIVAVAWAIFFMNGVNPFAGNRLTVFLITYALSLTPFVNLVPWPALWIVHVGFEDALKSVGGWTGRRLKAVYGSVS